MERRLLPKESTSFVDFPRREVATPLDAGSRSRKKENVTSLACDVCKKKKAKVEDYPSSDIPSILMIRYWYSAMDYDHLVLVASRKSSNAHTHQSPMLSA